MIWNAVGIIACAILAVSILNGSGLMLRGIIALRWCLNERVPLLPIGKCQCLPHLIILVPALREQAVLARVLQVLDNYAYPRSTLTVVVITAEKEVAQKTARRIEIRQLVRIFERGCSRERFADYTEGLFPRSLQDAVWKLLCTEDPGNRLARLEAFYDQTPTTPILAQELVERLNASSEGSIFHHVHCPLIDGTKASQLNYVIERLRTLLSWSSSDDDTYVVVCDADSVPDPRTGRYIASVLSQDQQSKKRLPAMLQQVPIPIMDVHTCARGFHKATVQAQALLQVRRSFCIEIYNLIFRRKLISSERNRLCKALLRPMIYGVGAGLYVQLSVLRQIGLFPEPVDDLGVGYKASMLDLDIVPIPYFGYIEPYGTLRQWLQAFSFVLQGSFRVSKDCARVARLSGALPRPERLAMITKEWIDCVGCFIRCPVFLMATIIAILYAGGISVALLVLAIFLQSVFPVALMLLLLPYLDLPADGAAQLPRGNWSQAPLTIVSSIFVPIASWGGASYYAIRLLLCVISGRRLAFGKTER